ncbi:putative ketol-acid reductoisomerase (NADP(+)) [Helianthus anomalus]
MMEHEVRACGMGPSVRRLYVQGKYINEAGIYASFVVHQTDEPLMLHLHGLLTGSERNFVIQIVCLLVRDLLTGSERIKIESLCA